MAASLVGSLALGAAAILGIAMRRGQPELDGVIGATAFPVVLYVMMIAYQGVRLGRSTHIVDMADETTRAAYTALSNTAVGVFLVAGGIFGALAARFGDAAVLLLFSLMCLAALTTAAGLDEVQR